jgi:tyrosyl-tRNA synthetase
LQKRIAGEITTIVHSGEDLKTAVNASDILFGKGTTKTLKELDESTFLNIFEGVPIFEINYDTFKNNIALIELLVDKAPVFESKGELRRLIQGGGLSINKEKVDNAEWIVSDKNLLNNKYLLVQKGKKNYYLIKSI